MHRYTTVVSNPATIPAEASVAWIGDRPIDEEPRVIWEALTHEQVTTYAALVERVGERLFRRDLASLGAAADIGFFLPFYRAHARRLIGALDGAVLRIGAPA